MNNMGKVFDRLIFWGVISPDSCWRFLPDAAHCEPFAKSLGRIVAFYAISSLYVSEYTLFSG